MGNNNEILNELFFKKKSASYTDNLKSKMTNYSPVTNTKDIKNFFTGGNNIGVSDIGEVKKRLVSSLGMALGSNTVKSMASKAIKSFPIIISDDISSETAVMIKNAAEEQYASYIDLLVSNQIINIADYKPGSDEGNIAIQALKKLDGTEFGMGRIARQAQTGNLSVDDIMKNEPWWQLIRTNENYKTGNPLFDLLLEDAIIVPSENVTEVCESLLTESVDATVTLKFNPGLSSDDITKLWINELVKSGNTATNPSAGTRLINSSDLHVWIYDGTKWIDRSTLEIAKNVDVVRASKLHGEVAGIDLSRFKQFGKYYEKTNKGLETRYNTLLSPYVLKRDDDIEDSLGASIASLLIPNNNDTTKSKELKNILRDKFTKATFLLTSRRISGSEYISYLVDRLGIPVSDALRKTILMKFRIMDTTFKSVTRFKNTSDGDVEIRSDDVIRIQNNIANNESVVLGSIVPSIVKMSGKDVAKIIGASLGVGAAAGGATAGVGLLAGLAASSLFPIILVPVIAGSLGTGLALWLKKRFAKKQKTHIEGWERVEQLINNMDAMQNELLANNRRDVQNEKDREAFENSRDTYKNFENKMYNTISDVAKTWKPVSVTEDIDIRPYLITYTENMIENLMEDICELEEILQETPDVLEEAMQLDEAKRFTISTTNPSAITIKNVLTNTKTKIRPKDFATIVPEFGTKDMQAYGTVEYDKRDLKDRKFNDPLILTIRFKERYADDKFSDNEMTAVIGIKGVITRVPSNEMETILRSNTEGKTLAGFFKGDENNNSKNLIGNVISAFMGTKYADQLPTSGKIWSNLEKIGQLAIANKLSGNNNGNVANAHLVFSQKEIDRVRSETGVDYLHDTRLAAQLMKKYSAFTLMVCDDALQKVYTFSDPDAISWDDAPYSAYIGKSNSDQLISAFTQAQRMRL